MRRSISPMLASLLLISLLSACNQLASPTPAPSPEPSTTFTSTLEPSPTYTSSPTSTATPTAVSLPADWTWTRLYLMRPAAFMSMSTAYDTDRGVTVLFGGRDLVYKPLSQTWEFDGNNWKQVYTEHVPQARFWHAMTYDSARKVVVLFGGEVSSESAVYLNETWEYDGTDWRQVMTPHSPSPRGRGPSLVYDSCHQKSILFGGESSDKDETWEYNGSDWTRLFTSIAPAKRALAAMVFDPTRCKAVLFGGVGLLTYNDTWEFDGTAWTRVNSPASPTPRWAHAMVYSPTFGAVVLFGGYQPSISAPVADTWLYDGWYWTEVKPKAPPYAREQHILSIGYNGTDIFLLGNHEMWSLHAEAPAATQTSTVQPTSTPTLKPSSTSECATGWTHLSIGIKVRVTGTPTDPPNRVRSGPSTSATQIGLLYPGVVVDIIAGPVCADGLVFWKVESSAIPGGEGWTAEGDGMKYWLEPYTP